MNLVFPSAEHKEAVIHFYNEIKNDENHIIGFGAFEDYESWLAMMQNRLTGKDLPEHMVKETYYLCFDENRLIGVLSIKHELNDYLLQFGGHIGYAVRPSQRRKGYATAIFAAALEKARELGIDKILAICDKGNIASAKTICKNGGILENEVYDPDDELMVQRYWISGR
ncbi:GNAT family N-acetyltransferase [Tumebacillus lipolyticus]|uniref:GNAT family N-acetyltransferase n=1 Tax=Tumebacillus lipolyticus TaxID=1280370 RepID=A0ABW4ZVK9_9BACL